MTHIIIVTYNATPWISKCLCNINFDKYDVIIVDNNSSDETVDFIKSNYKSVILLQQEKNLGFGQANNLGISYALNHGAKYVFLLNQDAYLVDDGIEHLVAFQSKNNEYGILSPIHVNADKTKLDRNFSNYLSYDKNPYFFSDFVLGNPLKKIYDLPFINAAGWLLSKSCLKTVGGFDPLFFHYGEDDNYCQRLKYHGFEIGILPNTFIIHDRENRPKTDIKLFSKEYYARELRQFKVRYANVNNYDKPGVLKYKNRFKKQLIKAYLKNDRHKIKNLRVHLECVRQIIPEIEYSVKTNKIPQPNYLDLK